jgi:hypothetical protein
MALASLAPGRLRQAMKLGELEAIHFPFTVMLPPPGDLPAATTILDLQHEDHPEFFSRAQLLYRRRFYRRPLLESDFVIRARATNDRPIPAGSRARAGDPPRGRPRNLHAGRAGARALPPLPRQRLAAQKPREAVRGFGLVRHERPEPARAHRRGHGP